MRVTSAVTHAPGLPALLGIFFPIPARTALVVAAGLSQIGEFSFIVGQAGVRLGVLTQDQYSLILAGALLSIMVNPLMFRLIPHAERLLQKAPKLWRLLDRHGPAPAPVAESLDGHVVIVGYGRVGQHLVDMLGHLGIPRLVVEIDAGRAAEFERQGVPTLYGDAANSEVLDFAQLGRARALVVTLPNEAAAEMVVAAGRSLAPELPIIARAATRSGVERLIELGAQDVIHPELEGGLEVLRHTLLTLRYPPGEVQQYADAVRRDQYELSVNSSDELRVLDQLIRHVRGIEIAWVPIAESSSAIGQTLAEANIRAATDASVIAILRDGQIIPNPKSATRFAPGDVIAVIGDTAQIASARNILAPDETHEALAVNETQTQRNVPEATQS
jgi:CPA2 family monovalent cation:H+ antiporter-2